MSTGLPSQISTQLNELKFPSLESLVSPRWVGKHVDWARKSPEEALKGAREKLEAPYGALQVYHHEVMEILRSRDLSALIQTEPNFPDEVTVVEGVRSSPDRLIATSLGRDAEKKLDGSAQVRFSTKESQWHLALGPGGLVKALKVFMNAPLYDEPTLRVSRSSGGVLQVDTVHGGGRVLDFSPGKRTQNYDGNLYGMPEFLKEESRWATYVRMDFSVEDGNGMLSSTYWLAGEQKGER